jgi:branched-chain amino acid transport system permease protein
MTEGTVVPGSGAPLVEDANVGADLAPALGEHRLVPRAAAAVAACVVVILIPYAISDFWLFIAGQALIFSVLAVGLNVSVGICRQANFGVTPYYALGAYGAANIALRWNINPIILLVAAAIAGALSSYVLGLVLLRLRQFTFALGTFVVATALSDYLNVGLPASLGGGTDGLAVPSPTVFGYSLGGFAGFYLCAFSLGAVLIGLGAVMRTRVGRAWSALGRDPTSASANGIHVRRYSVLAYSVSGGIAGLAGALFACVTGSVVPDSFSVAVAITALLMIVLGGLGSLTGPVVGAVFITVLNQYLQSDFSLSYPTLVDGVIILLIIRLAPGGLVGLWHQGIARLRSVGWPGQYARRLSGRRG